MTGPNLDELERDAFDGVKLRAALPFLLADARRVEALREALRELVDSRDALEGETVSFELQHATVDRFEAAMTAARAALEGASDE